MAELADALHSGCSVRKDVQVRLLFRALFFKSKAAALFVLLFLFVVRDFKVFITIIPSVNLGIYPAF